MQVRRHAGGNAESLDEHQAMYVHDSSAHLRERQSLPPCAVADASSSPHRDPPVSSRHHPSSRRDHCLPGLAVTLLAPRACHASPRPRCPCSWLSHCWSLLGLPCMCCAVRTCVVCCCREDLSSHAFGLEHMAAEISATERSTAADLVQQRDDDDAAQDGAQDDAARVHKKDMVKEAEAWFIKFSDLKVRWWSASALTHADAFTYLRVLGVLVRCPCACGCMRGDNAKVRLRVTLSRPCYARSSRYVISTCIT
jgi:hypothetical protein